LDIIGVIGVDPGTNWPVGAGATSEFTLVRQTSITDGETNWTISATEWDVYPQNTTTYIGSHTANPCCTNTFSSLFITNCDAYFWVLTGQTYTSSGSYNDTIPNTAGCDSVITLNLTINSVSDISTSVVGTTISANNASATYQWLDCNNNNAVIPGETNQSYTASANGLFAVELTENGCVDTSACVNITTVGIFENTSIGQFAVYPNPTNGQISIVFANELEVVQITLRNVMGQVVFQKKYSSEDHIDLTFEGSPGIYFLEIVEKDISTVLKLIKE
jgi:hypothetical protein